MTRYEVQTIRSAYDLTCHRLQILTAVDYHRLRATTVPDRLRHALTLQQHQETTQHRHPHITKTLSDQHKQVGLH